MYNKNSETLTRKPMTFEELVPIWSKMQKIKAKTALLRVDRAKTTLSHKDMLNKFAQLGGRVVCDKAIFTYDMDMGMGLLITPTHKILGATISDFLKVARG
jgi:hypothetical protein